MLPSNSVANSLQQRGRALRALALFLACGAAISAALQISSWRAEQMPDARLASERSLWRLRFYRGAALASISGHDAASGAVLAHVAPRAVGHSVPDQALPPALAQRQQDQQEPVMHHPGILPLTRAYERALAALSDALAVAARRGEEAAAVRDALTIAYAAAQQHQQQLKLPGSQQAVLTESQRISSGLAYSSGLAGADCDAGSRPRVRILVGVFVSPRRLTVCFTLLCKALLPATHARMTTMPTPRMRHLCYLKAGIATDGIV